MSCPFWYTLVMKNLFYTLSIILISSCSTTYQSSGFTGGYVDTQLSETLWKVSVKGNAYTSSSTVGDYALLRASELTLEKGYKYFVVASEDKNKTSSIAKLGNNTSYTTGMIDGYGNFSSTTNSSSPTYVPLNKFENTLVYEMTNEKIQGKFVYDAQLIYNSLSSKYIK